jgi:eukaryotic-like serine/threonine-protein kinase
MELSPYFTARARVGDVIAKRYRLEALIGEGGYGAVFQATQLDIGREVAIKLLRAELTPTSVTVGRFQRESMLAQQLEHPNTVRLLDFGQTDSGLPYIAYELLRGRSLGRVLTKEGPMPPARVARIACQALGALMEAHERGIVHRDVKPDNIFLVDFPGAPDFVKVLDFGVAKSTASLGASGAALTASGEAIGTPGYMAPEQVRGDAVGPATDLYALGLVMAELLSGRPVVTGAKPIDVCIQQASPDPVPLPPKVLESPLGAVIARAVAKRLEERYHAAGEMLADIEAAVEVAPAGELESPLTGPGAPRASSMTIPDALGRAPSGVRVASIELPPTLRAAPVTGAGGAGVGAGPGERPRLRLWLLLAFLGGALFIGVATAVAVVLTFIYAGR